MSNKNHHEPNERKKMTKMKQALDKLRDLDAQHLQAVAYVALELALPTDVIVGKSVVDETTGKVIEHPFHLTSDPNLREQVEQLKMVCGLCSLAMVGDELTRRINKGDAEAVKADKSVNRAMTDVATCHALAKLERLLGKEDDERAPKKPGDNKRPTDFRLDLGALKPSDN